MLQFCAKKLTELLMEIRQRFFAQTKQQGLFSFIVQTVQMFVNFFPYVTFWIRCIDAFSEQILLFYGLVYVRHKNLFRCFCKFVAAGFPFFTDHKPVIAKIAQFLAYEHGIDINASRKKFRRNC